MSNPWDQYADESCKAFAAFIVYRDLVMSARTFEETARHLNKNASTIKQFANRHNWRERVRAWDAHIDRQTQHNQIEAVKAMKERQIASALMAQKTAEKGLRHLIKQFKKDEKNGKISPYATKPDSLAKLFDTGCRIERLNRDEPEQNMEVSQPENYDNLSVEEMADMRKLMLKARGQN